jgi:hypothetical protein
MTSTSGRNARGVRLTAACEGLTELCWELDPLFDEPRERDRADWGGF